jgi:hypothetical protein
MLCDQKERARRTTAAGEDVNRSGVVRRDEPMQIVGVLVGRALSGAIGAEAALGSAGVVRHDSAVGEVPRQGAEAGGTHRGPDQQQDRLRARVVSPNVIGQRGAGHVQGLGSRLGHVSSLDDLAIQTGQGRKTHRSE